MHNVELCVQKAQKPSYYWYYSIVYGDSQQCRILADERELVFAFFDEADFGNGLIFGGFDAVDGDGVTSNEFAGFALAGG